MTAPTHTPPTPPKEVVERCAATAGSYGGCHGATTSGLRLPDSSEYGNQVEQSLDELSESMRAARLRWEAGKVSAR